jgi:hypothetical protein
VCLDVLTEQSDDFCVRISKPASTTKGWGDEKCLRDQVLNKIGDEECSGPVGRQNIFHIIFSLTN